MDASASGYTWLQPHLEYIETQISRESCLAYPGSWCSILHRRQELAPSPRQHLGAASTSPPLRLFQIPNPGVLWIAGRAFIPVSWCCAPIPSDLSKPSMNGGGRKAPPLFDFELFNADDLILSKHDALLVQTPRKHSIRYDRVHTCLSSSSIAF